jgi:hypothetical protein
MEIVSKGKQFFKSATAKMGLAAVSLVPALALADVDTTEVNSEIAAAAVAVAAIGSAVVLVMVGIAVYKWIRRAL